MGSHTSITIQDIAKLQEPRNTYLDLLLFDEKEVEEKIKNSTPLFRVFLTRLAPAQKFSRNGQSSQDVLESVELAEIIIAEKDLYDLGELGRAMCLTVGRYAHNHFRPFLEASEIEMDPFVSREHGLIFLNEKQDICYHDIGTFKKGSTNGTKLNDCSVVKNEIIPWNLYCYFGLGECVTVIKSSERVLESKFKLRYQRL